MVRPRALEGLWSAELGSDEQFVNIGVLMFEPKRLFGDFYEEGRILGGDRHHVYVGDYTIEDGQCRATFRIQRYDVHDPDPLFTARADFTSAWKCRLDPSVKRDVVTFTSDQSPPSPSLPRELRLTRRE